MTSDKDVRFYLHHAVRKKAEAGKHNFINKFCSVLKQHSFTIHYHTDKLDEVLQAYVRPGHSVFLMQAPLNDRGLTIRLNYYFPFWTIERNAKRWERPVSLAAFDASAVPNPEALRFAQFWRKRLYAEEPETTGKDGFVYVPLQGRLLAHRSFQYCSPIEMLEHLVENEKDRDIVVTLHPKETYSKAELSAINALVARHQRLILTDKAMLRLLQRCDYVVTQNSSVALAGYFFRKPAVLFGLIDFHHISARVHQLGPEEAIALAPDLNPDFDAYIWWFLQHHSINAGRPDAEDKITAVLQSVGWIS